MTENDFLEQLKSGDSIAFKSLVKQFQNKVYSTTLSILQNTEDAEDLTQEVFVEVFQSIHKFKGDSKLSTWIYRIAVTKSLEFLRKKKAKKRFAIVRNLLGEEEPEPIVQLSDFYHPGIVLENKERAIILFAAIGNLPENQKTAFVLHKLEDLSYEEIAKVMQVTLGSVESLMFRAKKNLRKLLEDYYEKNER
jgi:RNA polymerase sigma-70 factor (ECF subfamily)